MTETLADQLIRHEGMRLMPYICPAGKLSIGVGRNLDDRGISRGEAYLMLGADISAAKADVTALLMQFRVSDHRLNDARKDALANMAFNLGRDRLAGFKKMFAALAKGDFDRAADEILDSKYARDVGARATELAEQMRSGNRQK